MQTQHSHSKFSLHNFNYPQRLMNKLILIWICERRVMGGGYMGETNSQSQGMQTCKWMCRKPSEVSLFPPHNHTARGSRREKVLHANSWELFSQFMPHFHPQTFHFLWFQNPASNPARLNSSWSKNQCQFTPILGARTAVQKALVVSPIFSSNSHLLTSKFFTQASFGC